MKQESPGFIHGECQSSPCPTISPVAAWMATWGSVQISNYVLQYYRTYTLPMKAGRAFLPRCGWVASPLLIGRARDARKEEWLE